MSKKSYLFFVMASLLVTLVSICISLSVGEVRIPIKEVVSAVFSKATILFSTDYETSVKFTAQFFFL